MAGGRPLKYKNARRMKEAIDRYFDDCDAHGEPYRITGLALTLGTTRKTLIDYENRDEFSDIIKHAKQRCEDYVEKLLLSGKSPAGPIFWLKNAGWTDKQEIDVNDITQLTKDDLVKKLERMQARPIAMRKKAVNDSVNSDGSD